MDFFQAMAIISFAALISLLVWQARGSFSKRRIGGKRTGVTIVLTSGGSAGELEQSVKGLAWLISNGTLDVKTVIEIKNSDASPETSDMARMLENEYHYVVIAE